MNSGLGPAIHKITPSEGPKAGGIEVTCLGDGFRPDSIVNFGDVPALTTTLYSEKALLCRLPPAKQAGPVRVTIGKNNDYNIGPPPQDEVHFRYIDNDEQEMMRHALQVLNQQFAGGTAEAQEFARHILASMERTTISKSGTFSSSSQRRQASMVGDNSKECSSLEYMVLQCVEMVDLDDRPNEVNLNHRGANGQGMLHTAASLGYYRLVAGLLARGANPDLRDYNGMTPMHMACLNGHPQIIRKLRSTGADSTIRSLNGLRPTDVASSRQARKVVDEINYHSRCKSAEATPTSQLSRASSVRSVGSHRAMERRALSQGVQNDPDIAILDDGETSLYGSQLDASVRDWPRSRGASFGASNHITQGVLDSKLNNDAEVFAASPAMSAWREQISVQIQQLQQSVHRALPPIPNLPDYQAYPVVRRISNLVPQRSPRVEDTTKLKETDYRWWELLTGTAPSPPAYEEIYPHRIEEQKNEKKTSVFCAMSEAMVDQKCETLYSQAESSSIMATVNIGPNGLTKHQQDQLRTAHARKVKKLRSDRNLFFVWVCLL